MQLRNVNLNLLPVLQALLHERSVSNAADRLAMSQSAASEALGRLRLTLGDPLLHRVGSHMELTPRAHALRAPLDDICRALDRFLQRPVFDAMQASRTFQIAGADYAINHVGPGLIAALREEAPGVAVKFLNVGEDTADRLISGEIDLAIIPPFFVDELSSDNIRYTALFDDREIAIFDRSHPLTARRSVSRSDLDGYRMIMFHPGWSRVERRHVHAFSAGEPFRVAASVPEVAMVPKFVRGSLDFGIIPSKYRGEHGCDDDIVERPLAFDTPTLEVGLAWSAIHDADPGHRWLGARTIALQQAKTCANRVPGAEARLR